MLALSIVEGRPEMPNIQTVNEGWSPADWVHQHVAATAYALRPKRLAGLPGVLRAVAAFHLTPADLRVRAPDPRRTLAALDGFAGICPDLAPDTLMAGYRSGLYQASHAGPYKWWSPTRRMVLFLDELHLEKNLRRKLRQGRFRVTFDSAFEAVVQHCAGPRRQRRVHLTWLLPPVIEAYAALHRLGHAHSVEVWDEEGRLAGGLFGVSWGRLFTTESQFALDRDASKIAFAILNRHLQAWGYVLNDVHNWSAHLERLGCALIPRDDFLSIVEAFGRDPSPQTDWTPVDRLCAGDWEPAAEAGWTRHDVVSAVAGAPAEARDEARFAADANADANAGADDAAHRDGTMPSAA